MTNTTNVPKKTNTTNTDMKFRPWLFVIAAFLLLLTAWSSLIFIAVKHAPQSVPLQTLNSKP